MYIYYKENHFSSSITHSTISARNHSKTDKPSWSGLGWWWTISPTTSLTLINIPTYILQLTQ